MVLMAQKGKKVIHAHLQDNLEISQRETKGSLVTVGQGVTRENVAPLA